MSDPDALAASLSSPEVRERVAHEGNEPPLLPGSEDVGRPRSLWRDAYDDLRRRRCS